MGGTRPASCAARPKALVLLGAIVLAALAIRLVYLQQIRSIPFFYELVSDAEKYNDWARAIAAGDWLGEGVFYQAPLYPYFLALIKVAFGDDPYTTRLVQAALGALSCGLIGLAGWGFFGRRAGLWAAGILAAYPPAIFYGGLIQKTCLGQFLLCAWLALMGLARRESSSSEGGVQRAEPDSRFATRNANTPRLGTARRPLTPGVKGGSVAHGMADLAVGVVLGLFCLTRENALAVVPVVLVWAWARGAGKAPGPRHKAQREKGGTGDAPQPSSRRSQALAVAAVVLGLAMVLLPVAVRNWRVGGQFALTTSQMGPNFYIGNSAEATGRYVPLVRGHETPEFEQADAVALAERNLGRALSPHEVSRYWLRRSWEYVRSQPFDWLKLLGRKWLLVWNAYEIPDTESYTLYRAWSWMLGAGGAVLHFGVLAPAATAGVVLTWSSRRKVWVLYLSALVMAAAVAWFYVFGRYRYPIVPVAVLFAGAGLAEAWALWRGSRNGGWNPPHVHPGQSWGRLLLAVLAALATAYVVNRQVNPERQLDALAWGNLGSALARQENLEAATACFERAVAGVPDSPEMRYNLGLALLLQNQPVDAVEQLRAALRLAPDLVEADYQLGIAMEGQGRTQEALEHYHRALERNPADSDAAEAIRRLSEAEED